MKKKYNLIKILIAVFILVCGLFAAKNIYALNCYWHGNYSCVGDCNNIGGPCNTSRICHMDAGGVSCTVDASSCYWDCDPDPSPTPPGGGGCDSGCNSGNKDAIRCVTTNGAHTEQCDSCHWQTKVTCTTGACNSDGTDCAPQVGYCIDKDCGPGVCSGGNTLDWCWDSYSDFLANGPHVLVCTTTNNCNVGQCHQQTCTVTNTLNPPCSARGDGSASCEATSDCGIPACLTPTACLACSGGGGVPPGGSPNPSSAPGAPIGYHDAAIGGSECAVYGWTCDPSNWNNALQVNIYTDSFGAISTPLVTTLANTLREDAVKNQCGNSNNYHGFYYQIPLDSPLRDGQLHSYYTYSIGIDNNGNPDGINTLLKQSPKSMTCDAAKATIQARAIKDDAGTMLCSNIPPNPPPLSASTTFTLTPSLSLPFPPVDQNGSNYVSWPNLNANEYYGITALAGNTAYYPQAGCICTGSDPGSCTSFSTGDLSHFLLTVTGLTWQVIFRPANPWYQVLNGNLHANTAITDYLPNTDFLISKLSSYAKSGIASYVSSILPNTLAVDADGYLVQDASHTKPYLSYYDHYLTKFNPVTPINKTLITESDIPGSNGAYIIGNASNTINLTGTWDIGNGQQYTFFVPGNLTISTDSIKVENGGMLVFIVNGDITVSKNTGSISYVDKTGVDPINSPQISGVFIADGNINLLDNGTKNRQLILAGTYVGNSVTTARDLTGKNNALYPAVIFVYRPDFWMNLPQEMKERNIFWQEVNP